MTGPRYATRREMSVLVGQGEVQQLDRPYAVPNRPDLVTIPYRRLAPFGTARRKVVRRRQLVGGAIGVYALTMLALAWEVRHLLLAGAGGVALLAAVWWLARVFGGGGCAGIHTGGCSCGG